MKKEEPLCKGCPCYSKGLEWEKECPKTCPGLEYRKQNEPQEIYEEWIQPKLF